MFCYLMMVNNVLTQCQLLNTLRPRQNGCQFPNDIFKCTFVYETFWIWMKISLKYVLQGPIINIPALVQILASALSWCWSCDKPLSESMMTNLLMPVCITWPQWVNFQHFSNQSMLNSIQIRCHVSYHGYAMREVSVNSTSLYETNYFSIKRFSCFFSHRSRIYWFLPEETKCVFPTYW